MIPEAQRASVPPQTDLQASAEAGRWLRALFDLSPIAIGFSRDGITLDANPAYVRLFGYSDASELRGRALLDQIAPSHREDILQKVAQRARGEAVPVRYETVGVRRDGSEFPFEITTDRMVLDEGPLTIAFITDISERERVRRELTETLELNRLVLSASTMGCIVYDAEGPAIFANDAVGGIIGATHAQAQSQNFRTIASWQSSGMLDRALAALATGDTQRGQSHLMTSFGAEIWLEYQFSRAVSAGRTVLLAIFRDTTAEHRARHALRVSEERLQLALSAVNDAVVDWNLDTGETFASPRAHSLFGFAEGQRVPPWPEWTSRLAPEDRAARDAVVRGYLDGTREEHQLEHRVGPTPGEARWILTRGRVVERDALGRAKRVIGTLVDIDARKRAEEAQRQLDERMRNTQKLEGLGVLAGGIAHDFNNILTVIQSSTTMALRDAASGASVTAHLEGISLATQRAAELCRQMLAYAGRARLVVEPVDLNALIREMTSILEVSVSKKATLARSIGADGARLVGDPTQIRQVLMNLVLNASEAIGDARGTIRVSTGIDRVPPERLARAVVGAEHPAGRYAWLEVTDDGCGMDEATVGRMFDPFFTTKFTGRGLGMAAVLGIVRGHRGVIEVDSTPGRGTRIRVLLPSSEPAVPQTAAASVGEFRGEGLVLMVDDEPRVRFTTRKLLEMVGFEVVEACDGEEALAVFREHRARVRLVLLDLTMPRMDGAEALRALRQLDPTVRVILASGYGAAHLEERLRNDRPDDVLEKPFVWERLIESLRKVTAR